jgi:branched-chain amino acid transport system substrate-binding protein
LAGRAIHRSSGRWWSWGVAALATSGLLLAGSACTEADPADVAQADVETPGSLPPVPPLALPQDHVSVTAPGVTDTEIAVSGVAAVTNPLGMNNGSAFDGVQAYFDMVNDAGGIYGRQLVLEDRLDDQVGNNAAEVERILSGGEAFAVLPVATVLFTGADALVAADMPTFGWIINNEWGSTPEDPRPTLFGQNRSHLGASDSAAGVPMLAKNAGKHRVGLVAYSVSQAADCAEGMRKSFDEYGELADAALVYTESAMQLGATDYSVQVSNMKDAAVDLVFTCLDNNGVVSLAREIKKQGLEADQLIANGYDKELLAEYGDLFEGSYVRVDFTPSEVPVKSVGLQRYEEWMAKGGLEMTENSAIGWLNADLFVKGLVAAGPQFDREKLVAAINAMDDYEADGMLRDVDWTKAHSEMDVLCEVQLQVRDGRFVVVHAKSPENPWVCAREEGGQLVNAA